MTIILKYKNLANARSLFSFNLNLNKNRCHAGLKLHTLH